MTTRLRRLALATGALGALLLGTAALPAPAQTATVTLRLGAQSPWASPRQPTLRATVQIFSDRDVSNGSLTVTILEPVLSRSELRLAMDADTGDPIMAADFALEDIEAGMPLERSLRLRVADLGGVAEEARVYPVRIDLMEGTAPDAVVATLRTSLVYLPEPPEAPLNLAWTFVVGHPIDFGPDGVFLGRALERRLAPGGSLDGVVGALAPMLEAPEQVPVDVVLSPTLLEDLRRMQDGYDVATGQGVVSVPEGEGGAADAARVLEGIRAIARSPSVELSAMPFAVPDLPQLVASGMAADIPTQLALGRESVAATLQDGSEAMELPDPSLLRPPGSSIDEETLRILRKEGVTTLLLEQGVVEQPAEINDFAPPATAEIAADMRAIVPDEGLQDLITDPAVHDDPHLGAQWVIADLAAIWLERPDEARVAALIVSGEQDLSPDFFNPFVRGISSAPWLRTGKATNLLDRFAPVGSPERVRLRDGQPIPSSYAGAFWRNRMLIQDLRAILVAPEDARLPDQLDRDLLLTQGSSLVDRQALGASWLEAIQQRVRTEFDKIGADTAQVVTLTSSGGRIPVRVTNRGDLTVRVRIEVRSSRLRFPEGSTRTQTLEPGQTDIIVFEATAEATGTFPVLVAIETPAGEIISETRITVRSTAYSLIALLITVGAVVVLLIVWGRRHLSRTPR